MRTPQSEESARSGSSTPARFPEPSWGTDRGSLRAPSCSGTKHTRASSVQGCKRGLRCVLGGGWVPQCRSTLSVSARHREGRRGHSSGRASTRVVHGCTHGRPRSSNRVAGAHSWRCVVNGEFSDNKSGKGQLGLRRLMVQLWVAGWPRRGAPVCEAHCAAATTGTARGAADTNLKVTGGWCVTTGQANHLKFFEVLRFSSGRVRFDERHIVPTTSMIHRLSPRSIFYSPLAKL